MPLKSFKGSKEITIYGPIQAISKLMLRFYSLNVTFQVDGTEYGLKDLPHSERNKFTIRKNSAAVEVVLDNSVKIKYDGNHRAIICVPNECGRNLTGVCGNFDGLPWNDLRTKSGKMAADTKFIGHEELGDSWKIDPTYEKYLTYK